MPMVRYWKTKESVAAKVFTDKNGVTVMKMEGEDELFNGFPRGHLIVNAPNEYSDLSRLKHQIKNQIFNESWKMLEQGKPKEEIWRHIKNKVTKDLIPDYDKIRYDAIPPSKMSIPIREIYRVLEKMESKEPKLKWFKEAITFILQEDDAYKNRLCWMVSLLKPRWFLDPIKLLTLYLTELEHAEVIADMKERVRLWRRIALFALEDPYINQLFREFCKEVDWNKLRLTKADKYHMRAKYFKCDWLLFEY
jgi:hypothetical protein